MTELDRLRNALTAAEAALGRGLLIAIEAPDYAGKTTQALWLSKVLPNALLTREAGGTEVGKQIRRIALADETTDLARLMLFCADRAQHVATKIKPALDSGQTVLCDRYHLSTMAYQAYGVGLPQAKVANLSNWACQSVQPDVTVYIDTSPAVRKQRAQDRPEAADRFEHDAELLQRVADGYAVELSHLAVTAIIDGDGDSFDVHNKLVAELTAALEKYYDRTSVT